MKIPLLYSSPAFILLMSSCSLSLFMQGASAQLGKCTSSEAELKVGLGLDNQGDRAQEVRFVPGAFKQQNSVFGRQESALQPGIVANFICDRLNDECQADKATVSKCRSAQEKVAGSGLKGGKDLSAEATQALATLAAEFNAEVGIAGSQLTKGTASGKQGQPTNAAAAPTTASSTAKQQTQKKRAAPSTASPETAQPSTKEAQTAPSPGKGQGGNATGKQAGSSSPSSADFCQQHPELALNDGTQIRTGACSTTVQGAIPKFENMVSTRLISPQNGEDIEEGQSFKIAVQVRNMQLGTFLDPKRLYYTQPQILNDQGLIIGHIHVVMEELDGLKLTDPTTFKFFKGLDQQPEPGNILSVEVTAGVTGVGEHRICSITGSTAHQPVIMPVAQRGSQDDCIRVNVVPKNKNNGQAASAASPTSSNSQRSQGQETSPTRITTTTAGPTTKKQTPGTERATAKNQPQTVAAADASAGKQQRAASKNGGQKQQKNAGTLASSSSSSTTLPNASNAQNAKKQTFRGQSSNK